MRKTLVTLVVVAVAVGAVVAWEPWADEAAVVDLGIDRAITESVAVRTLTDEITIRGELRRDELKVVTASLDGKVGHVAVVDGDIVGFPTETEAEYLAGLCAAVAGAVLEYVRRAEGALASLPHIFTEVFSGPGAPLTLAVREALAALRR